MLTDVCYHVGHMSGVSGRATMTSSRQRTAPTISPKTWHCFLVTRRYFRVVSLEMVSEVHHNFVLVFAMEEIGAVGPTAVDDPRVLYIDIVVVEVSVFYPGFQQTPIKPNWCG
jgi:hypothetical protein